MKSSRYQSFEIKPKKSAEELSKMKAYAYDPSDGVNTKVSIDDSTGYIKYGEKDSFPNFLIDVVSGSHTATSCLDVIASFIEGDGFENEDLDSLKINPRETFSSLHNQLSVDEAWFNSCFINVRYNPKGLINFVQRMDYASCRLGNPDKKTGVINEIYYNPYFGTKDYEESETEIYSIFNPNTALEEAKNKVLNNEQYKGQIAHIKYYNPRQKFYTIPYYWSGFRYFDVEKKIGEFHNTNLDNNFFTSFILKMAGDPDFVVDEIINDAGEVTKTIKARDALNDMLSNEFSGSENTAKGMVLWATESGQFPQIEAFPSNVHHDMFIALQQLVTDNIIVSLSVPPVLANIQVSGKLGNTQEITNSVALMHGKTSKTQLRLENFYKEVFKNSIWNEFDVKIKPFNYDLGEFKENG